MSAHLSLAITFIAGLALGCSIPQGTLVPLHDNGTGGSTTGSSSGVGSTTSAIQMASCSRNDGGLFGAPIRVVTGIMPPLPTSQPLLALGDLNGDGNLDFAVQNSSSDLAVLLGNGDGSFQPPFHVALTEASGFIIAPLGSPARPYLVAARGEDLVIERLQIPQAPLIVAATIPTESQGSEYVIAHDMNRDGLPDLVDVDEFGFTVFLASETGGWLPQGSVSACGPWPTTDYLGDFNEDGIEDIIDTTLCGNPAESSPSTLSVFFGNGDGTFSDAGVGNVTLAGQLTWLLGDLNEDGHLDALVYGDTETIARSYTLLLGRGDGTFSVGPTVSLESVNAPTPLLLHDLDGDGHLDYVWTDGTAYVHIAFGNGDGTFKSPVLLPVAGTDSGAEAYGAWLGDVNNDGRPDLVVNDTWDGDVSVFLNCGSTPNAMDAGTCPTCPNCARVLCPNGESCDPSTGNCLCGSSPGCPADQSCVAGKCAPNLCYGVHCTGGTSCYGGTCRCGSSSGPVCNQDQTCDAGTCS